MGDRQYYFSIKVQRGEHFCKKYFWTSGLNAFPVVHFRLVRGSEGLKIFKLYNKFIIGILFWETSNINFELLPVIC